AWHARKGSSPSIWSDFLFAMARARSSPPHPLHPALRTRPPDHEGAAGHRSSPRCSGPIGRPILDRPAPYHHPSSRDSAEDRSLRLRWFGGVPILSSLRARQLEQDLSSNDDTSFPGLVMERKRIAATPISLGPARTRFRPRKVGGRGIVSRS